MPRTTPASRRVERDERAADRTGSQAAPGFDRVLFLRHLAITAGALLAYLQQSALGIGYLAFAIVAASAALNFGCSFLARRPGLFRTSQVASSVLGVGCWTALAALTGGVTSPFLAGLWLEIILAAMLFALQGIVAVTLTSMVGAGLLAAGSGLTGVGMTLALQLGFLGGMGGLVYWVTRQSLRTEQRLVRERDHLDERLHRLAEQLEGEREVGRIGENVARLAHGLKNAVHSLRGFAALIEPTLGDRDDAAAALGGLRLAIDDLESLARLSLEEKPTGSDAGPRCRPAPVIARAVREISFADPKVEWCVEADGVDAELPIGAEDLYEVLIILLRNAVEAMGASGRGRVELTYAGRELCIAICDEGSGVVTADLGRIFKAGYTTKPEGSGYGLFLARRIVGDCGGRLSARSSDTGGTVMEVALPALGAPPAEVD